MKIPDFLNKEKKKQEEIEKQRQHKIEIEKEAQKFTTRLDEEYTKLKEKISKFPKIKNQQQFNCEKIQIMIAIHLLQEEGFYVDLLVPNREINGIITYHLILFHFPSDI